MSQLEPDELARLFTQAVEPIRAAPDGYLRIRAGIARRRRMRMPFYALAGVAAVAVFTLAVLALRPGQATHVVEPAVPILGSAGLPGPDGVLSSSASPRRGSGGGQDGDPGGTASAPPGSSPQPSQLPGVTPSGGLTTLNPTTNPTHPPGGSPPMPSPVRKPARDGDVDGDGVLDEVVLAGGDLEVRLSRGPVATAPMPSPMPPLRSTVVDINGDGFGEVIVRTAADNGVERYLLLRLTAPDTIKIVDGSDVRLVAGIDTSNGNATGFRCTPGSLVTYSGTSVGGGPYMVVARTWRLVGTELVPDYGGTPTSTTDVSLFRADCPGL